MKKLALILFFAIVLAGAPALAGNTPEFDAVGDDSANYFNDFIKEAVVANNLDGFLDPINDFSDWQLPQLILYNPLDTTTWPTFDPAAFDLGLYQGSGYKPYELFFSSSGQLQPDRCFFNIGAGGYLSVLTDMNNGGLYQYVIVLQMKPESDLNINIRDCITKHQGNIWTGADQTGRWRNPEGFMWVPGANPLISAVAIPGPFSTIGFFPDPFILVARTMPGLAPLPLKRVPYTTKALWEEGIVVEMPTKGAFPTYGYQLKQGDMIAIEIEVPFFNTVDVSYGPDNVIVKYVGIIGQTFTTK